MKKSLLKLASALIATLLWLVMPAVAMDKLTPAGDSLIIRRELSETIEALTLPKAEAEARYLNALERNPNFAPAHYKLAKIYSSSDNNLALEHISKAYNIDTLNRWYTELYAEIALRGREISTAEKLYKKILSEEPRNINAYRLLAIIYESTQRPAEAIELLDSATVRIGSIAMLEGIKQRLQVGSGRGEKAIAEIKSRIESAPEDIDLHLSLSNLYTLTRRDSLAEGEIRRALEINPDSSAALIAAADHYLKASNYDEYFKALGSLFDSDAITTEMKLSLIEQFTNDDELYARYFFKINPLISTLIIRTPNEPKVIECYAHHLIRSGMLDQALELYKSHIEDRPLNPDYIQTVIEIESYKQRPDSIDLYINRAIELFPESVNFRISKAITLTQAGDYLAAIGSYKSALTHITDRKVISDIWGSIGDLYHQINVTNLNQLDKKELKESFKAYDKALEYNPENIPVLNNYAYYLSELNIKLEQAAEFSLRTIEAESSNSTFLDTYGWILYKMGQYEKAKEYLHQAASLDRYDSPEIQLHYGDLLEKLGEKFMAEVYWKKAEKMGYDKQEIELRLNRIKEQ